MPSRSQASPLMTMQRQHELQGPRPATLKVKKQRPAQVRPPVIIYVESPKVVHAHPSEFKSVVQRLTGARPAPTTTFASPASALQFPFQLYGQALNDGDYRTLPFVVSTLLPTAAPAPPVPGSLFATALPAVDAGSRSLSFFGNDQLNPAFLFDHQNMVPVAVGPGSSIQANQLLVSSAPLLLPYSGACHGDLFNLDLSTSDQI